MRRLTENGREVRGVDNLARGKIRNLEGIRLDQINADLRDYQQTLKVIAGADIVYHLAGRVGNITFLHGDSAMELETMRTNLVIDANVLRACEDVGVRKLVYASSVSVYPITKQSGIGARFSECDIEPIKPDGGYGWAKLIGEIQAGLMKSCNVSVARIFETYGPRMALDSSAQVVPSLIIKALGPTDNLDVWGDGNQTRNLLYIDDLVDALLTMGEKADDSRLTLNIGNPNTVSIRELALTILRVCGKKANLIFDITRPIGPVSRIPDIRRAQEVLKWYPRVELEEGIGKTLEWIKNQHI